MSSGTEIDKLRGVHGKIVAVELPEGSGKIFCFRKPRKAEVVVMNKAQRSQPDMSVEHAIGLCRNCFVGPATQEEFEKVVEEYCLAFAGSSDFDGVAEHLVRLATGEAKITVK